MKILDGKLASADLELQLRFEILNFKRRPKLAIIILTKDASSQSYLTGRQKVANKIGVELQLHAFDKIPNTEELLDLIKTLNEDKKIDGIMVDRPFPKSLNETQINNAIDPIKDVEGVSTHNIGWLCQGETCHIPPTAASCLHILKRYEIPLAGKNVTIIGRSPSVGRPLIHALMNEDATVTICHSKTRNLVDIAKRSDILIVSMGKPSFITEDYLNNKQVVIDVGIHYGENDVIIGDVLEEAKQIVACATPTPGGVGPVTNYTLFSNLVNAYKWRNNGN